MRNDACVVQALELLNSLALLEVSGDVLGVGLRTAGSIGMGAGKVDGVRRHAGSEVHDLVDTLLELVFGTDNQDHLVILRVWWEDDTAASLGKEVVESSASLASDELVSATLNGELLSNKLSL